MKKKFDMAERSLSGATRGQIVECLLKAVRENGGSLEYDIPDDGRGGWEGGVIHEDSIFARVNGGKGRKYLIAHTDTDVLESYLDALGLVASDAGKAEQQTK